MGIYIPGMELPTCCETCILDHKFFKWLGCNKHVTGDTIADGQRSPACPLIEVPEPHGRLGDLDELHKEAVRRSEKAGTYGSWYNCTDRVISAFDIKNAPTVIHASEEGEI